MSNASATTKPSKPFNDRRPDDTNCPFPAVEGLKRLYSKKQSLWYYADLEKGAWWAACSDGVPEGFQSIVTPQSTSLTVVPVVSSESNPPKKQAVVSQFNQHKPTSPPREDNSIKTKRPWHHSSQVTQNQFEDLKTSVDSLNYVLSKLSHEQLVLNNKLADLCSSFGKLTGQLKQSENTAHYEFYANAMHSLENSVISLTQKISYMNNPWISTTNNTPATLKKSFNTNTPKKYTKSITVIDGDEDEMDDKIEE